jgi:hypothetical protein
MSHERRTFSAGDDAVTERMAYRCGAVRGQPPPITCVATNEIEQSETRNASESCGVCVGKHDGIRASTTNKTVLLA